jgi:folate-dependent tRNA-U54 methylase TrmFO/GidA
LEDDERSGQPKAVKTKHEIEEFATMVCANRSQSIDDITEAVGISYDTCHKILTDDLNMSSVSKHCVPRILTQDQRDDCMTIRGDLISSADEVETFLNQITGDET